MGLRWDDERYVRLYTRDTVTWKRLTWQGRAMLPLILRKLDRAGIADLGEDAVDGLAALTDIPREVCMAGLASLLDLKVFCVHGTTLVAPKFIEAQEAPKSDRIRQQEKRGRDRSEMSRNVTSRHEMSRPSQNVTPSLAVPSLAVPSLKTTLSTNFEFADQLGEPQTQILKPTKADEVFAYWMLRMEKRGNTAFDKKRKGAVQARLRDGYSVEDLMQAIDGCAKTPHNTGQNDRGERFDDLELICRNSGQVDRFRQNAKDPPVARNKGPVDPAASRAAFENQPDDPLERSRLAMEKF